MSDGTQIEWTDATWNPITGCTMVSAGCSNCYAMGLAATRLRNHPSRQGLTRQTGERHVWTGEVRFNDDWIDQPMRWRRPRRIFVCAHGDLFHPAVPDAWIDQVFGVMTLAPQHTFQVLTKRPDRMRAYMNQMGDPGALDFLVRGSGALRTGAERATRHLSRLNVRPYRRWPLPNVWLGTSVEDQATAEERIPHLLETPAAVRFVSAEPLLGPVDLADLRPVPGPGPCENINAFTGRAIYASACGFEDSFNATSRWLGKLHWVIAGGESGPGARPMHPKWPRALRDQCEDAGVAFLFKQWGEWEVCGKTGPEPTHWAGDRGGIREVGNGVWASDAGVRRVGKARAGRLLDGRTHNEFPGQAT